MKFLHSIVSAVVCLVGNGGLETVLGNADLQQRDNQSLNQILFLLHKMRRTRNASYVQQPSVESLLQSVVQQPQQLPCIKCNYAQQPFQSYSNQPCVQCTYRNEQIEPIRPLNHPPPPTPQSTTTTTEATKLPPEDSQLPHYAALQSFSPQLYRQQKVTAGGGAPMMMPGNGIPFMMHPQAMMGAGLPTMPMWIPTSMNMLPMPSPYMHPGGFQGFPTYNARQNEQPEESFGISFELGGTDGEVSTPASLGLGDMFKGIAGIIGAGKTGSMPY